MRLISQLIRGLLTLLLIAIFGMGGAGAALGDWSRGGYPVSEHSLSVQSLDLAFTARAPPTSGRKLTFAGAALVQAGSMYALDGVEASGVVYTHLRSSIATNKGVVNRYGPLNEGPLPDDIARTFRSGTYDEVITTEPTTLYRVIGDNGNPAGGYWTRVEPQGPFQSVIDSALDQNWGNTATRVIEMEVPAGTRLFEGVAAPQRGLVGGGNQIFFDRNINPLDPAWIQ